jgi:hypothetical protein
VPLGDTGEASAAQSGADPAKSTSGLAVGALITAIAGFVVCGVLLSPAAVIMGVKARTKIRTDGTRGEGLATAAIVVGILGFVLNVVVLAAVFSDPEFLNGLE